MAKQNEMENKSNYQNNNDSSNNDGSNKKNETIEGKKTKRLNNISSDREISFDMNNDIQIGSNKNDNGNRNNLRLKNRTSNGKHRPSNTTTTFDLNKDKNTRQLQHQQEQEQGQKQKIKENYYEMYIHKTTNGLCRYFACDMNQTTTLSLLGICVIKFYDTPENDEDSDSNSNIDMDINDDDDDPLRPLTLDDAGQYSSNYRNKLNSQINKKRSYRSYIPELDSNDSWSIGGSSYIDYTLFDECFNDPNDIHDSLKSFEMIGLHLSNMDIQLRPKNNANAINDNNIGRKRLNCIQPHPHHHEHKNSLPPPMNMNDTVNRSRSVEIHKKRKL